MYESKAWTLTTRIKKSSLQQAVEMMGLHLIKGMTRRDRTRNEAIRRDLEVECVFFYSLTDVICIGLAM